MDWFTLGVALGWLEKLGGEKSKEEKAKQLRGTIIFFILVVLLYVVLGVLFWYNLIPKLF